MLGCNNENRNCGCMPNNEQNCECMGNNLAECDCHYTPQGINAAFGYNTMGMQEEGNNCGCSDNIEQCCQERNRIREEMIGQIKCLNFAIIELGLYLNTHSNDQKALCLHKEYCRQLKELKDKYQKIYGPLSIYYPCNKWRWLEEPWPWEGGNY